MSFESDSEVGKLAYKWYTRLASIGMGHYRAAMRYSFIHKMISIPAIVFSAAVGTTVFASMQQQIDIFWQVMVGAMSVLAAVMTALQSTLGYQELAEKHRAAGANYNALGREMEFMFESGGANNFECLDNIRQRIDSLAKESPHIPKSVHGYMHKHGVSDEWVLQEKSEV
ncbi:SLATT domain-containing protein [Pseudomonas sp. dw_612]|nr:SLATT domain-containing protein [Pseudomonas sp. dw_612]